MSAVVESATATPPGARQSTRRLEQCRLTTRTQTATRTPLAESDRVCSVSLDGGVRQVGSGRRGKFNDGPKWSGAWPLRLLVRLRPVSDRTAAHWTGSSVELSTLPTRGSNRR